MTLVSHMGEYFEKLWFLNNGVQIHSRNENILLKLPIRGP